MVKLVRCAETPLSVSDGLSEGCAARISAYAPRADDAQLDRAARVLPARRDELERVAGVERVPHARGEVGGGRRTRGGGGSSCKSVWCTPTLSQRKSAKSRSRVDTVVYFSVPRRVARQRTQSTHSSFHRDGVTERLSPGLQLSQDIKEIYSLRPDSS